MVFNIIQNGNRSCYKCGNRLGFMEGSLLDRLCDACKRREDEERKAHQQQAVTKE